MAEQEGKTKFRKYAAALMASATIGAVIYGYLTGIFTNASEGLAGGIIVGLAAKYLWEESGT